MASWNRRLPTTNLRQRWLPAPPNRKSSSSREAWRARGAAGCKTASFTTFDLSGKYQVTKALQVYGSVGNVFDRIAPYDLSAFYGITHYNANYHQAGGLGRTYNVGVKYQFD